MKKHNYNDARDIPKSDNNVLVFGSNVDGWHGAGVALLAYKEFGAHLHCPVGRMGMSYAIRTKDLKADKHPSVPRHKIVQDIEYLYEHAEKYPDDNFYVPYTATGRNLNFYSAKDMAVMFVDAADNHIFPDNVLFNNGFAELMEDYIDLFEQPRLMNGEVV